MTQDFEQARQLFAQGIVCFETGQFNLAQAKFVASLDLLPGRVSTLTNLAATRIQLGHPADALSLPDQALAIAPDEAPAMLQRGAALAALGRHAEAARSFEQAVTLAPGRVDAWLQLGQSQQHLDRDEQALVSFDRALAIKPDLAAAWAARGAILKDRQRVGEAIESFERALAAGADAQLCGFFLASLRGGDAPAAAPPGYVAGLFDHYAETFDAHLVDVLRYQAHKVLVEGLQTLHPGRFGAALDLGCGTGLCAPLLRPLVERVDGVDLSSQMLAKARARGLYDLLEQADLAEHLLSTGRRYDLALSADVFPYVDELDPVFGGMRRVLNPGGWFCFSVELQSAASDEDCGFCLGPSQRYAHSEGYLRALAARHGFALVQVLPLTIREDQRKPIAGICVHLTLPAPVRVLP